VSVVCLRHVQLNSHLNINLKHMIYFRVDARSPTGLDVNIITFFFFQKLRSPTSQKYKHAHLVRSSKNRVSRNRVFEKWRFLSFLQTTLHIDVEAHFLFFVIPLRVRSDARSTTCLCCWSLVAFRTHKYFRPGGQDDHRAGSG
jgi:hypothetical protein